MTKYLLASLLTCILYIVIQQQRYSLAFFKTESLEICSLETRVHYEGLYAQIEQIQVYKNPTPFPIEAEYHFPRTNTSIFHKFEAKMNDHAIAGLIFESQEALDKHSWNLGKGNTTVYSGRSEPDSDMMKIIVGNIPAYEKVEINFSIIEPVEVLLNKSLSFTLLAVLTERHASSNCCLFGKKQFCIYEDFDWQYSSSRS